MDQLSDIQLADLLTAEGGEPSAQKRAAQLAAALRQQKTQAQEQQFMAGLAGNFNNAGATAMGKAYGEMGAKNYASADEQLQQIPKVGEQRLQRALEAQRNNQQVSHQTQQLEQQATQHADEMGLKRRQRFGTVAPGGTTFNVETGEMGSTSPVAAPPRADPTFKQTGDTRKEYAGLPEVKTFGEVQTSFNKLKGALSSASPAGDLAGITAFMKLLDPGSTVKDAEFANAEKAVGMIDRMQSYAGRMASGEKLTPEQRADFLKNAEAFALEHRKARDAKAKFYRDIAVKNGLNPDDVTGAIEAPSGDKATKKAALLEELKAIRARGVGPGAAK